MTCASYPSLQGRRVVITGGGTGIGAALVEAFVRQGADVSFLDVAEGPSRELCDRLAESGRRPVFHLCDLTDLEALAATFARIGPVDVLVNNAANDDRHALSDITPAYWDQRMAVNLRHILFSTQAVVDGMRTRGGGGVVINLGSISWRLGLAGLVLYETAKAGIEGMTRAMARDLGPDNIRVVCIVPGSVSTPRQAKWYSPDDEAEIVAQQCLKARIQPAHVASLALFLASDDASMCTGHEYWVDAGWA